MLQYSASFRRNLRRGGNRMAHKSGAFVRGAQHQLTTRAHHAKAMANRTVVRLQRKPPLSVRIVMSAYHRCGLKHLVLICVFLFYTFFGALIFLLIEAPTQNSMKAQWEQEISANRSEFVRELMGELFNNSRFLVYIRAKTTTRIEAHFLTAFERYEAQLDIKWTDQKLEWDYWNAVIFAATVCTTIGYGHIYPLTKAGKVLTMVYALGGIPLVLLLLQDLGKLLTVVMKYPWFQLKRCMRRTLRLFTKQSLAEMAAIEFEERNTLFVFDIPVPVAVALVVIWLWLCASVFCYMDKRWTLLEAFYFFFISLSTIGLGDLVPSSPHTLISMFAFILFGLSIVSMVINLLQMKMSKTYNLGTDEEDITPPMSRRHSAPASTVLGVLQCFDGLKLASEDLIDKTSRSAQTTICLPNIKEAVIAQGSFHYVLEGSPYPMSPDDVTQLVGNVEEQLMFDLGEENSNSEECDDVTVSLLHEEIYSSGENLLGYLNL